MREASELQVAFAQPNRPPNTRIPNPPFSFSAMSPPSERVANVTGHLAAVDNSAVFSPLRLGGSPGFELSHRIVMASMARHRVEPDGVPKADLVGE